ncbi:MAG: alkaline phosphatase D family protein [Opitutaceae bacterium]|nr:alkaline phosphatase D family protein [Opitutaceae bacterium]
MCQKSPELPLIVGIVFTLSLATSAVGAAEIHLAQGMLVGEVTTTTAIFQTRLTASPRPVGGDVPGTSGVARFEIATNERFDNPQQTPWVNATAAGDFIVKARVDGLQSATLYHYRVAYGSDSKQTKRSSPGSFRTLPAATAAAPVNFVLTSCLNYGFYMEGPPSTARATPPGMTAYKGADRDLGYPAIVPLIKLQPDFCIFDGDCVYYDHPVETRAQTQPQLRKKWHEQYVMPRFLQLFSRVPTYWLKDDHDFRKNDSDFTGDYEPSPQLGIATFREQVPIVDPADPKAVTYRTHRMGRDLQLWFVEGRDYRTPNQPDDGPEKTIWGPAQKAWLQRTIKASDATFKILVSPSPLIGPDEARKRDNHVNPGGFRQEGEGFLNWLKANGIPAGQFYVICGDRHWKYHSKHATGYEEFTCGAMNRENSRLGRAPGDANSTDPGALVQQFYTDDPPSGGFLHVAVTPADGIHRTQIEFTHYNDHGKVLYQHTRAAQ